MHVVRSLRTKQITLKIVRVNGTERAKRNQVGCRDAIELCDGCLSKIRPELPIENVAGLEGEFVTPDVSPQRWTQIENSSCAGLDILKGEIVERLFGFPLREYLG
jgi:hypothetical protein